MFDHRFRVLLPGLRYALSIGAIGLVLQGGMYKAVLRAWQRLGLADAYGETDIPL